MYLETVFNAIYIYLKFNEKFNEIKQNTQLIVVQLLTNSLVNRVRYGRCFLESRGRVWSKHCKQCVKTGNFFVTVEIAIIIYKSSCTNILCIYCVLTQLPGGRQELFVQVTNLYALGKFKMLQGYLVRADYVHANVNYALQCV